MAAQAVRWQDDYKGCELPSGVLRCRTAVNELRLLCCACEGPVSGWVGAINLRGERSCAAQKVCGWHCGAELRQAEAAVGCVRGPAVCA